MSKKSKFLSYLQLLMFGNYVFIILLVFSCSLHKNLIEHLNAEIVLSTIPKISVALHWLKATFLYVRIMKNPAFYGK